VVYYEASSKTEGAVTAYLKALKTERCVRCPRTNSAPLLGSRLMGKRRADDISGNGLSKLFLTIAEAERDRDQGAHHAVEA